MNAGRADTDQGASGGWSKVDIALLALVTTAAAILHLWGVARPSELVFDETYYAKDACFYVESSHELCDNAGQSEVHPPLGKWFIAAGIGLFGYDSFGWRVAPALAGTLTVALVYLLARKLLRSTLGATVASGLLVVDFLHFVQSRVAMLEVFVPLFTVAAFLFAVHDRDRILGPHPDEREELLLGRPWRIATGVALGAAIATKWSAVFVYAGVLVLIAAWEVAARRDRGEGRPFATALTTEGPSILLWLVVLPVLLYVLSYAGRLEGSLLTLPWQDGSWIGAFWRQQAHMIGFHFDLDATHAYQSPAWSWLALKRPVAYYFETTNGGDYREIMALGSPFVWWAAGLALSYTAFRWLRRRERFGAPGVIVAGFAFTFGPWLLMDAISPREAVFLFYLLPAVPFMCLALGYVATRLGTSWEARATLVLFSAAALWLFAFYHPVLAARPLSYEQWRQRVCFVRIGQGSGDQRCLFAAEDQCEKPGSRREDEQQTATTEAVETTDEEGPALPPRGWCWI